MISELNFIKLKKVSKIFVEVNENLYEDVDGFESLRIIIKSKSRCIFPIATKTNQLRTNYKSHDLVSLTTKILNYA